MNIVEVGSLPITITANGKYLIKVGGPLSTVGNFNTLYCKGTWGGGKVYVKATPDGTEANAMDIEDGELGTDSVVNILVKTRGIIISLENATDPNLKVWVL
jgi:hypothetical protein